MTNIKKISVTVRDSHYIRQFLDNAGNSLLGFRYFAKRPMSVLENHICTYMFLQDEMPVCYGHLDNDQKKIWLGIAVLESKKGMGLGSLMMRELLSTAVERKIPSVYLTVDKVNSHAIHLYEKLGFKAVSQNTTSIEYCLNVEG